MPQRFSMALLMMVMVRMVSSANPPSVSATRGTKSVPEERQAERLAGSSDRRINAAREKQLRFGFITTVWTEVASPGVFVVKLQPSKIDNR